MLQNIVFYLICVRSTFLLTPSVFLLNLFAQPFWLTGWLAGLAGLAGWPASLADWLAGWPGWLTGWLGWLAWPAGLG